MSLDANDLDQISTRNELLFMKLMDAHIEHVHKPHDTIDDAQRLELWQAVNKTKDILADIKGDVKVFKFVGAAVAAVLGGLEGLLMLFKKGGA
jgi:hypothetical protein